jgi:hypothetical protein
MLIGQLQHQVMIHVVENAEEDAQDVRAIDVECLKDVVDVLQRMAAPFAKHF